MRRYRIRLIRGNNQAVTYITAPDIGVALRHARYCARVWNTGFDFIRLEVPC